MPPPRNRRARIEAVTQRKRFIGELREMDKAVKKERGPAGEPTLDFRDQDAAWMLVTWMVLVALS